MARLTGEQRRQKRRERSREYYLAQIGSLKYYVATLKQKKKEKGNKYNLPRYKIRIKG